MLTAKFLHWIKFEHQESPRLQFPPRPIEAYPEIFLEEQHYIQTFVPDNVQRMMHGRIYSGNESPGRIKRTIAALFGFHQSHTLKWEDDGEYSVFLVRVWLVPTVCIVIGFIAEMITFGSKGWKFKKIITSLFLNFLKLFVEGSMF